MTIVELDLSQRPHSCIVYVVVNVIPRVVMVYSMTIVGVDHVL
jgi:hypothetical protein